MRPADYQFIRDLASASSSTGEAYHVRCGAVDSIAKPWLEAQLKAATNSVRKDQTPAL